MIKFFCSRLILSILVCSSFLFSTASRGQDQSSTIDLTEDSFREFTVLSSTLDEYQVYFTGENHTFTTFNTQFQLKFLKYLHQTQNVKHFMFEQSPGFSYIINKVVIEDKTTHLHFLDELFFSPFYEMVKELRKYNDTLALEDKIKMHGIDIERFPAFSLYALSLIVDTLDKSGRGGQVFEQIKALASSEFAESGPEAFYSEPNDEFNFGFGEVSAWTSLQSIILGAYEFEKELRPILGNDSTTFYSIIESIEIGHEWYITELEGDVKSPIIRERFMADEFLRVYTADSISKYYGQFGRCHLHKDAREKNCYDYYMNSIANRINEVHPSLNNEVMVIPIFYTKSRDFDKEVIESLELEIRYTESEESFIIDLAYKGGDHSIAGFYENLPYVIISNAKSDMFDFEAYQWGDDVSEIVHLSVGVGYSFLNKLNKLNFRMNELGLGQFNTRVLTQTFSFDYFIFGENGSSVSYNHYPEFSNGDRFTLKGGNFTIGGNYPLGGKFFLTAIGFDMGYGQFILTETLLSETPNLIQIDSKNKVVYRNDLFTLDPNIQFRLALPFIGFHVKAGYAFDVSGKYWRLDELATNFAKTSFSAAYVQVGASLNFKN